MRGCLGIAGSGWEDVLEDYWGTREGGGEGLLQAREREREGEGEMYDGDVTVV